MMKKYAISIKHLLYVKIMGKAYFVLVAIIVMSVFGCGGKDDNHGMEPLSANSESDKAIKEYKEHEKKYEILVGMIDSITLKYKEQLDPINEKISIKTREMKKVFDGGYPEMSTNERNWKVDELEEERDVLMSEQRSIESAMNDELSKQILLKKEMEKELIKLRIDIMAKYGIDLDKK